jgi:hypothetical protein
LIEEIENEADFVDWLGLASGGAFATAKRLPSGVRQN